MAWLLVDLHRSGVYWGDCSLANTLFRRDGDKVQAFLVDAETSEIHPVPVHRAAQLRPRHPRGERRVRAGRPGRAAGPPGGHGGRDRSGRVGPRALRRVVGRDHARTGALAGRSARDPGQGPCAERSRVRRRRDRARAHVGRRRRGAAAGRRGQSPLPRPEAGAAHRPRCPRGPGAAPAQRPRGVPLLDRVSRGPPAVRRGGLGALAPGRARTSPRLAGAGDRSVARSAAGLLRRARGEVDPVGDGRRRRRPGGRDGGLHRPRGACARIRGRGGHVDRARHRLVDRLRGWPIADRAGPDEPVRARRPSATIGA